MNDPEAQHAANEGQDCPRALIPFIILFVLCLYIAAHFQRKP